MSSLSLAERLAPPTTSTAAQGGRQPSARRSPRASLPYSRPGSNNNSGFTSKAPEGQWKHDAFAQHENITGGTLMARMQDGRPARSVSNPGSGSGIKIARNATFDGAIRDANGTRTLEPVRTRAAPAVVVQQQGFTIKGVSKGPTWVEVHELAQGTTAEDVEAIFKRCGEVLSSSVTSPSTSPTTTVRVKFQRKEDAEAAVKKFDRQPADGRTLRVMIVYDDGGLHSRIDGAPEKGNGQVRTVDHLINNPSTASKMRSDAMVPSNPPPTTTGSNQNQRGGRGGRRGGGGGGGRGRTKSLADRLGGSAAMDLD